MKHFLRIAFGMLLAAGLAYQAFGAGQYLTGRLTRKVLGNRSLDAVVRSADVSYGGEFAGYIAFLRSTIPERARVLIPAHQGQRYDLNDLYLMQYFLFPRDVLVCPAECSRLIADPAVFIIMQDDFPALDLVPPSKPLVLFSPGLGLYVSGAQGK